MHPIAFQAIAFVIGIAIGVVYYLILAKNSKNNKLFFKTLFICALAIIETISRPVNKVYLSVFIVSISSERDQAM